MPEVKFKVEGMHCSSCTLNVKKSLEKIDGVKFASVDLATKSAVVECTKEISFEEFYEAVKKSGYELIKEEETEKELLFLKKEKLRLILSWVFTIPLALKMILSMIFHLTIMPEMIGMYFDVLISGIVIFVIGFPIIKSTFLAIKNLSFNMDSLIGIGTIASFSTGVLKLLGINIEDFSVVGAMIMSINYIGNYLKDLSTGKASEAIKKLIQLGAKEAHLLTPEGIIDVPVNKLMPGDVVLVKEGEKIPSDGVIVEGFTTIDESMVSGESMPVDKKEGDKVIGATINQTGFIKVRIEKVGKDTFLSQVIKMVEEAQRSKVPIQQLADKITGVFVPLILLLSVLTFLLWYFLPDLMRSIQAFFPWMVSETDKLSMALFSAIATLVIACPCALGLATPTALMVGMGKAAISGILIRNGEAIQRMKDITTVVFDKTGTITKVKPSVSEFIAEDKTLLFNIAYAIENLSNHPLARAITAFVNDKITESLKVEDFSVVAGKGLKGKIQGKVILSGNIKFLKEEGINVDENELEKLFLQGKTLVGFALDGNFIGAFAISDEVKEDSKEAIKLLHSLGLKTAMLTGDNNLSAEYIAKTTGIDTYFAELLPHHKIEKIKALQSDNVVAFVGDGINDAPALKQADIGIAIGSGTDIAIESADITLVSGSLTGVYKAFIISRKTFDKIKENLFWAFFYNVIAIPLAMMGVLHPLIAEIAMALSSINVVFNSLRLGRVKV
ncbi:MAG: heavy metal translocating P-type ATPase [Brevinematia bacterium]